MVVQAVKRAGLIDAELRPKVNPERKVWRA